MNRMIGSNPNNGMATSPRIHLGNLNALIHCTMCITEGMFGFNEKE